MQLDKKIEGKIKREAFKYLNHRPNWDVEHVKNAVRWMKMLIKEEGGNEKVLLPAIYFHDSGYPQLKPGYSYDDVMAAKDTHAIKGAEIAKNFLSKLNCFTSQEIEIISQLINDHDKYQEFDTLEGQLVYEADRLSQIDFEKVKPNFNKKNCEKWFNNYWIKRKQYMKTKTGMKALRKLEKYAKEYIKNWPEKNN